VCLAASSALNVARKLAYKRAYTHQISIIQFSKLLHSTLINFTIAQFWELVADFSAVFPPWIDQLNHWHPFLLKSNGGDILLNLNQSTTTPHSSR